MNSDYGRGTQRDLLLVAWGQSRTVVERNVGNTREADHIPEMAQLFAIKVPGCSVKARPEKSSKHKLPQRMLLFPWLGSCLLTCMFSLPVFSDL